MTFQIRGGKIRASCNQWGAYSSLTIGQGLEHPLSATAEVLEHLLHCTRVGWRGLGFHVAGGARRGENRSGRSCANKAEGETSRAACGKRTFRKSQATCGEQEKPLSCAPQEGEGGGKEVCVRDWLALASHSSIWLGVSTVDARRRNKRQSAFPRKVKFELSRI